MSFRFFQSKYYQRTIFINKAKKEAKKSGMSVVLNNSGDHLLDSGIGLNDRFYNNDFNEYIGVISFSDGSYLSASMYEVNSRIEGSKGKTKRTLRSGFSFEINYDKNYFESFVKVEDTHHKLELIIHREYLISLVLPIALFIDHVLYYGYPTPFMVRFLLIPLGIATLFIAYTSRSHRNRKRTQLEDTDFEGNFDVITKYPVFARQLLTPDIMSKVTLRAKTCSPKIKPTIIFKGSTCEVQFDLSRYNGLGFFSHAYTPYIKHFGELYKAALRFKKIVDDDIVVRL